LVRAFGKQEQARPNESKLEKAWKKMPSSSTEMAMFEGDPSGKAISELLSAVADGEASTDDVAAACTAWSRDPQARAAWHGYQLIGDVLRSEDLGPSAAGDAAFLAALRTRMAAEPVVLAPQAAALPQRADAPRGLRTWRWAAPAAVAASVMVATGWLVQPLKPQPVAVSAAPAPAAQARAALAGLGEPQAPRPLVADAPAGLVNAQVMLRDPQLDGYFAAHKQYAGNSAVGMPSGVLRNATVELPAR